jgi:hypothetical protein
MASINKPISSLRIRELLHQYARESRLCVG